MKKYIYFLILSASLVSCGGGGDTPPTPVNHAPTTPSLSYPSANLLCIDNVITFQWNASTDSDGDVITYQVQVATDNAFTQIEHTLPVSTTSTSITLTKGTAYYWRVKATDSKNSSSDYSAVNSFYTEGVGTVNHLPFLPELVAPTMGAIEHTPTSTLQWTATDDTSDTLTFDVYLGTANPPTTAVATDLTTNSFTATVSGTSTYYWKVVVKDDKGGKNNWTSLEICYRLV